MLLNPPVKGAFRLAAWSGREAASRPALGLRQWFCLPSSQSAAMFPGRLLRISHNALGKPHYRGMAVYSSELWDEIRGKLSMFPGGSVNLVKQESGIAVLTVNNPDRMNAFSGTMMLELQDRVSQLENWKEGKGLIVHGAGGTFCSGSDLNAVRAISNPQDGMKMCMFMQDTLTRLLRLPLISVALVEGRALGGGAELTTACDFRLMTPSSEIQFVHKHMGLVPGWGGAARLVRIVGSQGALKLLAAALKVDSALAEKIGLSDGVVAAGAGTALAEAEHWLGDFTRGPAPVIQAIKKVALSGRELPLEDALREEKEVFGTVWGESANLEALARKSKHK